MKAEAETILDALRIDGDSGSDYVLNDYATSCWVEVGNVSVYIIRGENGVYVELLPKGDEGEAMPLDTAFAAYPAAEQ